MNVPGSLTSIDYANPMRVHLDCFPCFLRQVVIAVRLATKDERIQEETLREVLSEFHLFDLGKTPAHAATYMHRKIRAVLGADPFREIKSEYNNLALGLYPSLKQLVTESPDPLWTASRLAIAGNVIDFGIFTSVDIEGAIGRALNAPLAVDHYSRFREAVEGTRDILYLLDNTGEAVFDRLLIETLMGMGKDVTAVAKGGPVINDCTVESAEEAGIHRACEVIGNGTDAVGTILEMASDVFRARFSGAGLIISKGQGNFETLLGHKERIFFLFQSKCDVVSKVLGLSNGSMLLKESPGLP